MVNIKIFGCVFPNVESYIMSRAQIRLERKEWSDSGDVIRFNKAQFVARGYDYRLKLTTEVYDANGKFVEDDVTYSGVESH